MKRGVFCNNKGLKILPRILAGGSMKPVQCSPLGLFYFLLLHLTILALNYFTTFKRVLEYTYKIMLLKLAQLINRTIYGYLYGLLYSDFVYLLYHDLKEILLCTISKTFYYVALVLQNTQSPTAPGIKCELPSLLCYHFDNVVPTYVYNTTLSSQLYNLF